MKSKKNPKSPYHKWKKSSRYIETTAKRMSKYYKKYPEYASFRAIKSMYNKKYGDKIGKLFLIRYLIKLELRGIDTSNFNSKL